MFLCKRCKKYFTRKSHYNYHKNRLYKCKKNNIYVKKLFNKSPLNFYNCKAKNGYVTSTLLSKHILFSKYKNLISSQFDDGTLEFYFQKYYDLNIVSNIKTRYIYIFWHVCKNNNNELVDILSKLIKNIDKSLLRYMKYHITITNNLILIAAYYFILSKLNYGNIYLNNFNNCHLNKSFIYTRLNSTVLEKIKNLNLTKFSIENSPIHILLDKYESNENIILINDSNPLELYNILKDKKNWILFVTNSTLFEQVKNVYKYHTIITSHKLRRMYYKKTKYPLRKFELIVLSKNITHLK